MFETSDLQDHKVDALLVQIRAFLAPTTDLLQPTILAKVFLLFLKKKLGLVE